MNRIWLTWLLSLSLVAVASVRPDEAFAADGKVTAHRGEPEHPLGLVAFASIDRLKARAESLAEALGRTGEGESVLASMMGGDEAVLKLVNSPGLDTTRPIGAMCFPKWFSGQAAGDDEEPDLDLSSFGDDPFSALVEGSATLFTENATLVMCFPCKDRDQLLEDLGRILATDGDGIVPIDDQPGWYRFGKDDDMRICFASNYLLLVHDEGEVKQFDRHYPDFAKLARSSLGKNGFVYALYRKGLPFLVRDMMGPAFKLAYAAQFQQRDGESNIQFRMRTMSSSLQMQLLDLAISHVDEIRITGHVDSTTRTIVIEPEIIGAKGGKLAKYFNDGKPGSSIFAGQPTDDAVIAGSMSLPLPTKEWKPTVEALYGFAQSQGKSAGAEMTRAFAKTIESGQFEIFTYNPSWSEGLIALRLQGGASFPGQFQEALAAFSEPMDFAVDAVDGIPIHRIPSTLDSNPILGMLGFSVMGFLGQPISLPDFEGSLIKREILNIEGTPRLDRQNAKQEVGANSLWLAATPRAVFLGFTLKSDECPDWFKTQIAANLAPSAGRSKTSFQVTLRQLGSTLDSEIEQVAHQEVDGADTKVKLAKGEAGADATKAELADMTSKNQQARANLIRDLPNAIRCEFRPTETGAKLSITMEEAYFQWFAAMVRDSHDEQQIRNKLPPENLQVAPGGTNAAGPPQ